MKTKLLRITNKGQDPAKATQYLFFCPGCQCGHVVEVPRWTWNGSMDKPTFSPSILTGTVPDFSERRCHSYVKEGKIQFLSDCYHELRNQVVELPDIGDENPIQMLMRSPE